MRQDTGSSRYLLTLRFCGIADKINANLQVYNLALPVMREISLTLRESVCLAVEQNAMRMHAAEAINVMRGDVRSHSFAPMKPPAQKTHISNVNVKESTAGSHWNSAAMGALNTDQP